MDGGGSVMLSPTRARSRSFGTGGRQGGVWTSRSKDGTTFETAVDLGVTAQDPGAGGRQGRRLDRRRHGTATRRSITGRTGFAFRETNPQGHRAKTGQCVSNASIPPTNPPRRDAPETSSLVSRRILSSAPSASTSPAAPRPQPSHRFGHGRQATACRGSLEQPDPHLDENPSRQRTAEDRPRSEGFGGQRPGPRPRWLELAGQCRSGGGTAGSL